MASEDMEDWDDSFLEELIQVEERALFAAKQNQNPLISCYLPPCRHAPNFSLRLAPTSSATPLPESSLNEPSTTENAILAAAALLTQPPSAPSHHTMASDTAKDIEIQKLKVQKKLGRISKQLTELEHECLELKNERNKELVKTVDSGSESQIGKWQNSKTETIGHGFSGLACHVISQEFQNEKSSEVALTVHRAKSSSKDIGIQKDLPTQLAIFWKLRNIWGGSTDLTFGRNLILKLLAVCATDFSVLFGLMEINSFSRKINSFSVETLCDTVPHQNYHLFHASEAAKLFNIYCIVTKISSGTVQVQVLVDALVDLYKVQNALQKMLFELFFCRDIDCSNRH